MAGNDQERLERIESDILALDKKIAPLEKQRTRLYKIKDKILESISDSNKDNFSFLITDMASNKNLVKYCTTSQTAPHDYYGVHVDGYNYEINQWQFSLMLREAGALEAAKAWIEDHLGQLSPYVYPGYGTPMVAFRYLSEPSGLKWLCWEPSNNRWVDIEFRYGRVRQGHEVESLDTGLQLAKDRQIVDYD